MAIRTDPQLAAALRRISSDLAALQLPWALAGGLAVAAHTGSGATDDIDLVIGVADDATAEAIVRALQERGYAAVTSVEDEASARLVSVRLEVIGEEERVEPVQLLFASSGIEPEVAGAASAKRVRGSEVPVASIGHLLAMKLLSHEPGRPQDGEDIAALLQSANEADLQEAEDALVLISDRGFHRGRDLMAEYETFLAREPRAGRLAQ